MGWKNLVRTAEVRLPGERIITQQLAHHLDRIANDLLAARQVLLFSDFDGTLVPIKDRPEECHLDLVVARTLSELAVLDRVRVGIVSGRDIDDLRFRVELEGIDYAGNHGLEIEGPGFSFREPQSVQIGPEFDRILAKLEPAIVATPGSWIQRKRFTASIHFRQVDPAFIPPLVTAVQRIVAPAIAAQVFVLRMGKMVMELRPAVNWNKGHAVHWLAGQKNFPGTAPMMIYFGDDETDEDAFAALSGQLTVCVGENPSTAARYSARNPEEVHSFLNWMLCILRGMPVIKF